VKKKTGLISENKARSSEIFIILHYAKGRPREHMKPEKEENLEDTIKKFYVQQL